MITTATTVINLALERRPESQLEVTEVDVRVARAAPDRVVAGLPVFTQGSNQLLAASPLLLTAMQKSPVPHETATVPE